MAPCLAVGSLENHEVICDFLCHPDRTVPLLGLPGKAASSNNL